nr:1-deoxy-D-xylulose-5-phosphate reductoisomerase [Lachnospiraceae bacterium]
LNLFKLQSMTFEEPDLDTFKGLSLAYKAIDKGGNIPTAFNAANEFAVAKFLDGKIGYLTITDMIEAAMDHCNFISNPSVEDILNTEHEAYEFLEGRC